MKVEYTCFAKELPARMRGRLLVRVLTELEKNHYGYFIFAGLYASYHFDGKVLTIGTDRP